MAKVVELDNVFPGQWTPLGLPCSEAELRPWTERLQNKSHFYNGFTTEVDRVMHFLWFVNGGQIKS